MEETLLSKLEAIRQLTLLAAKKVLTFEDVALLTGLSKSYLYKLTSDRQIPFYKPIGKCLFFDKNEIESWMLQNRNATKSEFEEQAVSYVVKKGGDVCRP